MNMIPSLSLLDHVALTVLLVTWLGYPVIIKAFGGQDLTDVMANYRVEWMRQMLHRDERITDVSLARGLFSSVSFFSSTTVFIISGIVGMIASSEGITAALGNSPWLSETDQMAFEIKAGALLLIFIHSFFKFGWSMRLHTYSSILIGAAPQKEHMNSPEAEAIVQKASRLSTLASQHYFAGLRGYYFGLTTLTWFIHPALMIIALFLNLVVQIRRERFSATLSVLTD